jgi:hypothetical protein
MNPSRRRVALGAAVLIIVAAGFFGGRALRPDPAPGYAFDPSAAVYEPAAPKPALSRGGFSGFGETPGLPGRTLLSGKVTSVSPQELVIEAANGTTSTLQIANPNGVSRIEAATRNALVNGASVVVRHAEGSDRADAVLVVGGP